MKEIDKRIHVKYAKDLENSLPTEHAEDTKEPNERFENYLAADLRGKRG